MSDHSFRIAETKLDTAVNRTRLVIQHVGCRHSLFHRAYALSATRPFSLRSRTTDNFGVHLNDTTVAYVERFCRA